MHLFNNLRFFGPNMTKNTKENKFKMRLSMEENVFLFFSFYFTKRYQKWIVRYCTIKEAYLACKSIINIIIIPIVYMYICM